MLSNKEIYASMKRIEIVIYEESLEELLELFAEANIKGYTVIKKLAVMDQQGSAIKTTLFWNNTMLLCC